MKWYTVIVHVESHVTPTHYFHTRALTPKEADQHAVDWFTEPGQVADVEFVFEGRIFPEVYE